MMHSSLSLSVADKPASSLLTKGNGSSTRAVKGTNIAAVALSR
jgi:hypothetical protein